jgi:hypothetical protein
MGKPDTARTGALPQRSEGHGARGLLLAAGSNKPNPVGTRGVTTRRASREASWCMAPAIGRMRLCDASSSGLSVFW